MYITSVGHKVKMSYLDCRPKYLMQLSCQLSCHVTWAQAELIVIKDRA